MVNNYKTSTIFMLDSWDLIVLLRGFHLGAAVCSEAAQPWVTLYETSVKAEDRLYETVDRVLKENNK